MHHIACHQWSKFQLKLTTSGYSRKNPNRGVKSIPFYPPPPPLPLEFLNLSLCPRKFQRKQAFTPGHSIIFSYTPQEIPLPF